MKQLFFALLLVAILSSGYLKALQSQDDAAREVAQVLKEEKKVSAPSLQQSFEQVAKAVEATKTVNSPVSAVPEKAEPSQALVALRDAFELDGQLVDPEKSEVEKTLLSFKLEPSEEKLFVGRFTSKEFTALKYQYLIHQNRGHLTPAVEALIKMKIDALLFSDVRIGKKVVLEIFASTNEDDHREFRNFLQEQYRDSAFSVVEPAQPSNEQPQTESQPQNGEQP